MATLLHYPVIKVFEKDSTQVAVGAKIYTYLAGTSTLKTTYSDKDKTTSNTNPVITDSNGEATVWLDDDALYDITINDSSDVLIRYTTNVGETTTSTVTQGNYNLVKNGSFEIDSDSDGVPDDWTLSITSGSTIAIDSTSQNHGLNSLKFVGGSSGAGTATSDFFEVQASKAVGIRFSLSASAATVTQTVKLLWYTSAKAAASVSSTTVYSVTTTAPTSFTEQVLTATPGSDVRYGKIEISGSSSAGTTYYDNIVVKDFVALSAFKDPGDISSAAALPVTANYNYYDVTGSTTITSIDSVYVGAIIKLHFDSALTLTNHTTNLILPGGANITTASGDEAEFIEYATGQWRCTNYVIAAAIPNDDKIIPYSGANRQANLDDSISGGKGIVLNNATNVITIQADLTATTSGAFSFNPSAVLPAGHYHLYNHTITTSLQVQINSVWRDVNPYITGATWVAAIWSDGTNVRLNSSASVTNFRHNFASTGP